MPIHTEYCGSPRLQSSHAAGHVHTNRRGLHAMHRRPDACQRPHASTVCMCSSARITSGLILASPTPRQNSPSAPHAGSRTAVDKPGQGFPATACAARSAISPPQLRCSLLTRRLAVCAYCPIATSRPWLVGHAHLQYTNVIYPVRCWQSHPRHPQTSCSCSSAVPQRSAKC